MARSIAVFGVGPALGRAVARRYAREGYEVVLVARSADSLTSIGDELRAEGAVAHEIVADLADIDRVPELADRIRTSAGDPDTIYYGAAPNAFTPALELSPQQAADLMPLALYTPIALVQQFLPVMRKRGDGAIVTVQGAAGVQGMPHIAGGLAIAAQRNYLQSLAAELAGENVYVGRLYVGAVIEQSAFHAGRVAAEAAGDPVPDMPLVHPDVLAELVWTMQHERTDAERVYRDGLV